MDEAVHQALREYLLALADDELILGHRASEWCGHSPILEEDIAFANLALDELGHANLWYALAAELDGFDPEAYPDRLVYFRGGQDYRCARLVELPNGDWAFTMLRQYLFDLAEQIRLGRLAASAFAPVAEIAQKVLTEERYHHRHTQAWVRRLSLGTEESHQRMQRALNEAWPYTAQLFAPTAGYDLLVTARIAPEVLGLLAEWDAAVLPFLQACRLTAPQEQRLELSRLEHSEHLDALLAEMQALPRQEPGAVW